MDNGYDASESDAEEAVTQESVERAVDYAGHHREIHPEELREQQEQLAQAEIVSMDTFLYGRSYGAAPIPLWVSYFSFLMKVELADLIYRITCGWMKLAAVFGTCIIAVGQAWFFTT